MRSDLIDLLACPVCQSNPLEMQVRSRRFEEIAEADLICPRCGKSYPVKDGIPIMLPDQEDQRTPRPNSQTKREGMSESLHEKHKEIRKANITYYDAVAEVYEDEVEQALHQSDFNQRRMEAIVRDLAQKTSSNLFLDLGCGTGNLLKLGAKHFHRAIGIDVSFNMLKVARQSNLEVIQADVLFLPFKSTLFDAVSIFSVLHHIYDYRQAFTQISRVLRRGGYLYSDWDPAKKPMLDDHKISWGVYKMVEKMLFPPMRLAKRKINRITRPNGLKKNPIDFLKLRPDLREINAKAELHNLAEEEQRGIDFEQIERSLVENGFTNIHPTFHWEGRSFNQLPLLLKTKFFFLRFQAPPRERFMENIMLVAQRK